MFRNAKEINSSSLGEDAKKQLLESLNSVVMKKMKRNKYNNTIVEIDGIKFRSKIEAKRYNELKILKQSGDVVHFNYQVPLRLSGGTRPVTYYADFLVIFNDCTWRYEDTKGFRTPSYKNKKKLVKDKYGIEIYEL